MAWDTGNAWRPDWHGRWRSHKPGQALVEQNVARPLLRVRNTGTTERLHLFITVIAYQLVQVIRRRLAERGEGPIRNAGWTTLRRILGGRQRVTATFKRTGGYWCATFPSSGYTYTRMCRSTPSFIEKLAGEIVANTWASRAPGDEALTCVWLRPATPLKSHSPDCHLLRFDHHREGPDGRPTIAVCGRYGDHREACAAMLIGGCSQLAWNNLVTPLIFSGRIATTFIPDTGSVRHTHGFPARQRSESAARTPD